MISQAFKNNFEKRINNFASGIAGIKDEQFALSLIRARAYYLPYIQRQAFAERVHLKYLEYRKKVNLNMQILHIN